jgi:hypothetical protein
MLSDDADGASAPRDKDPLSRHLASCPSCRAYRESLLKLQAGALGLNRGAERPDAYWRDFGARLEARLADERASSAPARVPRAARRAWAWGGAGLAAAAAVAAAFLLLRPAAARPGPFVFSFEETVASILGEIGDDPELEVAFAGALQASIEAAVGGAREEAYDSPSGDPLFWEGLSDEDLARIESGLRKEKKT